ncbi:MAG: hypothetical protein HFG24_00045 [Anaerotruncus sp.]|nr:hypothetical protein [Anaerotruncus sp.]
MIFLVVVAAKDPDKQLFKLLQCHGGRISLLNVRTLSAKLEGETPDLVFATGPRFPRLSCENAVLILRNGRELPVGPVNRHAIAILNSSDPRTLKQAASRHLPALTCGRLSSDTFTLSSLTPDSAVISLQRPVHAFDGSTVEPFELPAAFSFPPDPFCLLACAAIFCLLGKKNPLAGLSRWHLSL